MDSFIISFISLGPVIGNSVTQSGNLHRRVKGGLHLQSVCVCVCVCMCELCVLCVCLKL